MAKVKYDVSDVEPRPDFDELIPKGLYRCKIVDCTSGTSQASVERGSPEEMLTVEYEITKGDLKGRHMWDYIVLSDSQAWKLEQLVKALGKRVKGTLDTDSIIGERVLVKVRHEKDKREGADSSEMRDRVGTVSKVPDDDEGLEDEDDEETEEEEDDEGTEDDLTREDLDGYDRKELKTLIKDEELEVRVTKGMEDEAIREAIAEELELSEEEPEDEEPDDDEEPEEEDDDDEGDELTYDDVMAMNKTELKELNEEEELGLRPTAKTKVASLRVKVADALELEPGGDEDDDEPEDDDDEPEEQQDYSDMSVADLRTELKSRSLTTSGAKSALVKRLKKDDKDGGDPF